ncbi:MAG TPA: calcium-translocating P-type ATPase, PMCA-type [Prevotella sp.]|jgi:Ca2+-transporting ATPase|nr:calcium-translocating P-type ATPase, PMCA-type [Prevotella sp.]
MTAKNSYTGLSNEEVIRSREQYGSNVLTQLEKSPWWVKFLQKFTDPLIIILLVAGLLSIGISFYEYFGLHESLDVFFEPVGIFIAILLATGLAFLFEYKADKEFSILNKVNDDELVTVIREGHHRQIAKKDVVVGDIVVIGTGDEIPADGELLESVLLNVDESSLTGEPIAHKSIREEEQDDHATFPTNQVMRGTKVMEGHGIFRVTAVGDHTENGKVYESVQIDNSVKTPLNEQLSWLGKVISIASAVIAGLIVVGRIVGYLTTEDFNTVAFISYVLQTIMIAVTLIVVAVPEGLPMAVTLSLAYSMRRMLKTNNLVRKLHACETMGAATVICTDKTGTLTKNQMQVFQTYFPALKEQQLGNDDASRLIAEGIAVNSTAIVDESDGKPVVLGNPTEGALLLWLRDQHVKYEEIKQQVGIVAEIPFSTERKYMVTVVESTVLTGKTILYVKGAPEIVMDFCDLPQQEREEISRKLGDYQRQAMRTIGMAYQEVDGHLTQITADDLKHLHFQGVVAISDPVREEVPAAIRECLDAGIDVKIITGDTKETAKEIGRRVGLWKDSYTDKNITSGPEIAAMTDSELDQSVMDLKIISRARPMDKKRVVESLQRCHQVVAVTGDGTNDAPALKAAHVGLSMGDGTSVAKEASDITIIDNSFSSITKAVMWGRSLYQNIQRFILFQMTVNVVACLVVLVGAFGDTQSPLTVTQMLWVNLIMDTFAAMALASLPPSEKVMQDKPRNRKAFIISRDMWKNILGVGLTFFVILFALLYLFWHVDIRQLTDLLHCTTGGHHHLGAPELSLYFTIFVMLQFWNMFNARAFKTGRCAITNLKHCESFKFIILLIFVGQILIVELGGKMFSVRPLTISDWMIIIASTSLVLWIGEIGRWIANRKSMK